MPNGYNFPAHQPSHWGQSVIDFLYEYILYKMFDKIITALHTSHVIYILHWTKTGPSFGTSHGKGGREGNKDWDLSLKGGVSRVS